MWLWSQKLWAKEAILLVPLSFQLFLIRYNFCFFPIQVVGPARGDSTATEWEVAIQPEVNRVYGRARTAFAQASTTMQGTTWLQRHGGAAGSTAASRLHSNPPYLRGFSPGYSIFLPQTKNTHSRVSVWMVRVMMDEDAWCQKNRLTGCFLVLQHFKINTYTSCG